MLHRRHINALALAGLAALIGTGLPACSLLSPKSDPSQFYVLSSLTGDSAPAKLTSNSGLAILVGPASVPGYLDRNQIVTALPHNELKVDEFHLWGDSIQTGMTRVLADNISHLLDSPAVVPYPQVNLTGYDYRISLIVRHFEKNPAGQVKLVTAYTIEGPPASGIDRAVFSRSITVPLPSLDPEAPLNSQYTAIAGAMSKALGELSTSVARNLLNKHRQDLRQKEAEAADAQQSDPASATSPSTE
jgi:uncharacterized lipoprotein YmbA